MFIEGTCVGLDVHARSILACAIDNEAGEIKSVRLSPKTDAVLEWVRSLPGSVAVTYEAGPTGFGLARALDAAGVRCVVVAPSKVERPPGDRVKTDRRDAERLARLFVDRGTARGAGAQRSRGGGAGSGAGSRGRAR